MTYKLCLGSEKPVRADGTCDRCFSKNMRGNWCEIKHSDTNGSFSIFPTHGYYTAIKHDITGRVVNEPQILGAANWTASIRDELKELRNTVLYIAITIGFGNLIQKITETQLGRY